MSEPRHTHLVVVAVPARSRDIHAEIEIPVHLEGFESRVTPAEACKRPQTAAQVLLEIGAEPVFWATLPARRFDDRVGCLSFQVRVDRLAVTAGIRVTAEGQQTYRTEVVEEPQRVDLQLDGFRMRAMQIPVELGSVRHCWHQRFGHAQGISSTN